MEKISIIVPIYNVENYLERCVKSLLNQTFNDFEIILVNDGSTDNCRYICDNLSKEDGRIKVIHKKNGGVSSARNTGIEVASGEFVGFIDPDDYLERDALEYLYNLMTKNKADIACYSIKVFKEDNLKSKINLDEKVSVYYDSDIIMMQSKEGIFQHSVCNKIYSKKILEDNNIKFQEEIHYAEDALFNYEVMNKAKKIIHSNLQKYNYCINKDGVVSKVTEKRLDILKAQKEIYHILNEKNYQYTRNIINEYINSSILIVVDIAREKNIFFKRNILKSLKKYLKAEKFYVSHLKYLTPKKQILFFLLKKSTISLALLYRIRFLLY